MAHLKTNHLQEFGFAKLKSPFKEENEDKLFTKRFNFETKDISNIEIAKTLGLSISTIERWKNGTTHPHKDLREWVFRKIQLTKERLLINNDKVG